MTSPDSPIEDKIAEAALEPKSAEVDGRKVSARSSNEAIEADRYRESKRRANRKSGNIFGGLIARARPPGGRGDA